MNDDYLWDSSGEPDPEVEKLERTLRPLRHAPRPLALPPHGAARFLARPVALLAAAALVAFGAGLWLLQPRGGDAAAPPYRLVALEGAAESRTLRPGDRVTCDENTRVRVDVGSIGSVELSPGTTLRVDAVAAHDPRDRYLLHLDRGEMKASIFAAPRLFQVGTPSGIAVDLGCVYVAQVRDDGATRLAVTLGRVSFETAGREVIVPSGAECISTPQRGPGTPVWTDAPPELKSAVAALDHGAPARPALDALRTAAVRRDTLTLWHLLDHQDATVRRECLDLILGLEGLRAEQARTAEILAGDDAARAALRAELEWRW